MIAIVCGEEDGFPSEIESSAKIERFDVAWGLILALMRSLARTPQTMTLTWVYQERNTPLSIDVSLQIYCNSG